MQIPIFRGGGCVKLIDVCNPKQWKTISASELVEDGYPVFGANGIIGYFSDYNHEKPTLCITCRGATCGTVNKSLPYSYITGNSMALDDLDESVITIDFLNYFLQYRGFDDVITGSAQPQITRQSLSKIFIPEIDLNIQKNITQIIKSIEQLILNRDKQRENFNMLVKSRFNEMFGGNKQFESIDNLFDIIDGDRGKNYPKSDELFDEEYCLFLNTKNVTKNGFSFITNQFITETKDKLLRKGKLERYDIVLTTRGTVGNVAYYDESIKYKHLRINSGMVILRPKKPNLNQKFIIHVLRNNNYSRVISGSAQPQLPITKLKKILLPLPPLSLQNEFADFVAQVDKSQFACQMALKLWRNSLKSSII